MTVDISYKDALNGIISDVLKSEKILESDQQELMNKIGKVIKKNVEKVLPRSEVAAPGYKHMSKDVKVTVQGKKAKTGITGVVVHGGKLTAYKWHMLDDGTRNPDGSVHTPATHFTDKAMKEAEPEINEIIDNMIKGVVGAL